MTTRSLLICLSVICCANSSIPVIAQPIPESVSTQVTEVAPLMIQFRADEGSVKRFYFVQNSPERRQRLITLYKDYIQRLENLSFESMSTGGRVDFILFRRNLENEIALLGQEEKECNAVSRLVACGDGIYQIEKQRRR